jgi:hypothetical protein
MIYFIWSYALWFFISGIDFVGILVKNILKSVLIRNFHILFIYFEFVEEKSKIIVIVTIGKD